MSHGTFQKIMSTTSTPGLCHSRLSLAEYAHNFADAHPPLTPAQARIEADRCYYCFDAPCVTACPTGIDVPSFIARIAQDNLRGAAKAILDANILGGMCARVCPTEVLCEQACVRNSQEGKPVEIGLLQRHATDALMADRGAPLFTRAPSSGRKVAVVGAGPAGLACAHRLAMLGHGVTLFERKPKLGGLNEYGLATYKTVNDFAQREIDWLLSIGGIEVRLNADLGRAVTLDGLCGQFDAVFLGLGLGGVFELGIGEPEVPGLAGLRNAVEFIAELRQAADPSTVVVGRRVVVIGGGMTAIDASVQSRLLGAQEVSMVYRRGPETMGASKEEQDWARKNGVAIRHWAAPKRLLASGGALTGVEFVATAIDGGKLVPTGETFTIDADMALKAIGQSLEPHGVAGSIELIEGRVKTTQDGRSSHPKVWAGGDCRHGGRDLTVEAVEHGKRAAISIDATIRAARRASASTGGN